MTTYVSELPMGEHHHWTFVIGALYYNVLSYGMGYNEVLEAVSDKLGDKFRSPFALIQMTCGNRMDFEVLLNRNMIDLDLT